MKKSSKKTKKFEVAEGHDTPNIKVIQFGDYEIDSWYSAPFPEEYVQDKLFFCEFCLKYMKTEFTLERHEEKCPLRHPPGNEIYRDGNISIFEVDGRRNKVF